MPEDEKKSTSGRRQSASERRAARRTGRPTVNPYATRTAAQRRAERAVISRSGQVSTLTSAAPAPRPQPAERDRAKQAQLDAERVAYLLEHPTKTVTPEELKAEYGYVIADLRNMFLLAGALVILLVALAVVLPR
ncbi:MAG: hypothetical protein ACUVS2_08125 [Candidatus Flexifilum sp.]|jgi:hypothetical protein